MAYSVVSPFSSSSSSSFSFASPCYPVRFDGLLRYWRRLVRQNTREGVCVGEWVRREKPEMGHRRQQFSELRFPVRAERKVRKEVIGPATRLFFCSLFFSFRTLLLVMVTGVGRMRQMRPSQPFHFYLLSPSFWLPGGIRQEILRRYRT